MESLGVFTSHLHLKQDPQVIEYSKSTHVGFHMALHCKKKSVTCEDQVYVNLQKPFDKIHDQLLKSKL